MSRPLGSVLAPATAAGATRRAGGLARGPLGNVLAPATAAGATRRAGGLARGLLGSVLAPAAAAGVTRRAAGLARGRRDSRAQVGLGVLFAALWLIGQDARAADPLGRLFHSPQERLALERARDRPVLAAAALPSAPPPSPPPPTATPSFSLEGVAGRPGGHPVVWVNGALVEPGQATLPDLRVSLEAPPGPSVRLQRPGGARALVLRPGQRLEGGVVHESYARPERGP